MAQTYCPSSPAQLLLTGLIAPVFSDQTASCSASSCCQIVVTRAFQVDQLNAGVSPAIGIRGWRPVHYRSEYPKLIIRYERCYLAQYPTVKLAYSDEEFPVEGLFAEPMLSQYVSSSSITCW